METKTLQTELKRLSVSQETANSLNAAFTPFFKSASEFEKEAKSIVITSENQVEDMKRAREIRLKLKNIRVQTEKKRYDLKQESLRKGKAIDGLANVVKYLIIPLEEHLQQQEDFIKLIEQKKKAELKEKRQLELEKYDVDTEFMKLDDMTEEGYQQILTKAKFAYDAQKKAEEEAEKKRLEDERLDRVEQQRINETAGYRRFMEKDYDFRTMSEKDYINLSSRLLDLERIEAEEQEKIRKENELLKKEAEKREAEEAKRRAKEEARLKAETEAREAAEAEARKIAEEQARKEAEEKARQEAERLATEEAERQKKLAPDKDKLQEFAANISYLVLPEVSSDEAKRIVKKANDMLQETVKYLKESSIKL